MEEQNEEIQQATIQPELYISDSEASDFSNYVKKLRNLSLGNFYLIDRKVELNNMHQKQLNAQFTLNEIYTDSWEIDF
ncbi:hypothetical protein SS50377_20465 [Spironucleus salmonicida]|uniref:Uncharacterized protein n=1 Tax=Spironucleus salmonicida TaxID=348837 RepID=V6LLN5_9EUKA|nr:hypothetical protein SS50377_20465 [Spironucleus salmonicida]|eukprot:EST45615.1 Hypothetical protein SS50377_14469 [Spironucleus salmonicida]